MSAITRLQKETGLEEPESAPDSMTGSPSFSPVHTSSSQSSLSSLGTSSSSADGKEEGSKLEHRAHKQLNIDDVDAPLVMAAELADDEVALAAVDGDEVDGGPISSLAEVQKVLTVLQQLCRRLWRLGTRTLLCSLTRKRAEVSPRDADLEVVRLMLL